MRIVFTGGGTLGSVTPLIAVADAVRAEEPEAVFAWIGTDAGPERRIVEEAKIPFTAIPSGKLRRYLSLRNFTDPFLIIAGFFRSLAFLRRFRPDAVVTAGGFVAVPVVWAAGALRVRVHVHQQDIRPGLANRLSLPFADSMSVAFEKSVEDYRRYAPVWTGNPVRRRVREGDRDAAARIFGLESGIPTVLVLGGGTGAASLNALVRKAAALVAPYAQVLHVTGKGKGASEDEGTPPRYHPVEFLTDDMRHAYAVADVVVTRAGMGTLTELAALGKPTIIVPMPRSHQEDNARFFAAHAGVPVLDETTLFSKGLADAVVGVLQDDVRRAALGESMRGLTKPDAAELVAEIVLSGDIDKEGGA